MATELTIYDIARRAGVGIATVSRVLNGSARVAESTRVAVQRAVDELGFRPNRAARRLATGRASRPRVVALMPFFSTNFYFSVMRPLAQELAAADIDLAIHDVRQRDDKQRLLDRIAAERSCEVLVLGSMGIGPERQRQFADLAIRLVSVDFPLPGVPSVTVDNTGGAIGATQHLLERGCRRPALLSGPSSALAFRQREDGFRKQVRETAQVVQAAAVTREAGAAAARVLLGSDADIDGLVCVNDMLAVGALEELRRRGRRVPEDVQVIGFDDQPLMDVIGLTTIHQPMDAFGTWAARAVTQLVADPRARIRSAILPLTLIARATTRAALLTKPRRHMRKHSKEPRP